MHVAETDGFNPYHWHINKVAVDEDAGGEKHVVKLSLEHMVFIICLVFDEMLVMSMIVVLTVCANPNPLVNNDGRVDHLSRPTSKREDLHRFHIHSQDRHQGTFDVSQSSC